MNRLLPPLCFLMALAMLVMGFAILSVGLPEANVSLHAARATGDDPTTSVLENDLKQQRNHRSLLIGGLFAGSAAMTFIGFASMKNR